MSNVHLRPDWQRRIEQRSNEARRQLAQRLADEARKPGITVGDVDGGKHEYDLPVTVRDRGDNDTRVTLAHPAGEAVHRKHRLLPRAAAALGLELRG